MLITLECSATPRMLNGGPGKLLKTREYILVPCFAAQDSIVSEDMAEHRNHVKSCLNVAPIAFSAQSPGRW
jgi:hypothetical protein